ncbi:MAG: hypothetical protein FWB93_02920 [Oscillospiraceae bacterium]|nr:hypothetical protein [Oscillospiraceae bacterium]
MSYIRMIILSAPVGFRSHTTYCYVTEKSAKVTLLFGYNAALWYLLKESGASERNRTTDT